MATRVLWKAPHARLAAAIAAVFLLLSAIGCSRSARGGGDFATNGVQGVRFDPSYYYNLKQPLDQFVDSSVAAWQSHGINAIFFKAYDPEYGAVYKTSYAANSKTDYGDKDLLRLFINAAHARGVRIMAWLPVFEHKGAWEAHPDWRIKAADGSDLVPFRDRHFLCVRQPGFIEWWKGFLKDLLGRYPDLDGVDFAEPADVWKGSACACSICRKEITANGTRGEFSPEAVNERAKGLTDLLLASSRIVRDAGRTACVTFIATSAPSSDIMPFAKQKDFTGLDLDRLLDSPDKPQWISAELMWQQWADTYDNPATFRPDWTRKAVEQTLAQIGTRAHLLAHVEITPLGPVEVSPDELVQSIIAARKGGAQSIEFYDTHLTDSLGAWTTLEKAWHTQSERRALVFCDPGGLGVAKQVAVLFGHFGLESKVTPIDSFAESLVRANDLVTYVGSKENYALPAAFLSYAAKPDTKIFWCDFNLWQLDRPLIDGHGDTNTYKDARPKDAKANDARFASTAPSNGVLARLGIKFEYPLKSAEFNTVLYQGQELFKNDSVVNRIAVLDTHKVKVYANVKSKDGEIVPYIIQSGNFWFVADCPTDYIVEGGRDVAFADLLHDFVGETHPEKHTALVRIEDVCALSDPAAIRSIADLLSGEGVPFSIALVSDYIDPEDNVAVNLSDRPELVKAVHYAISKGAAIVMHGDTHQYRGRSTHDYEFWDALHNTPIFEDSREYVRVRLQRGINEMRKNGIYPIVFETPHYACSQLDYGVIDQFFSTEYARRQVIDKTGFDQLVPYYIARHPSGNSIIPENLGYVPNLNQNAAPLLRFAKNNLAVRDGFASFFFHPWIKQQVLKDLVVGLKGMGYRFSDIRAVPLKMAAQGVTQVTGNQDVTLNPAGKYLRTFYLDNKGNRHNEWTSDAPVAREFTQSVRCPPTWSFVAEAIDKPSGWLPKASLPRLGILGKLREKLLTSPPLQLAQGNPLRPCLLWMPMASESSSGEAPSPATGPATAATPAIAKGFYPSESEWAAVFRASGIDVDTLRVDRFLEIPEGDNLLVVPAEAAPRISTQQALVISQWVAKGKSVILEGPSGISEKLGIHSVDSGKTARELKDDFLPQVKVKWPQAASYYSFDADSEYVNEYSTGTDAPLVAGGKYAQGKYLYFATSFAGPPPSHGPYRFPFFLDMVQREFALFPAVRSPNLEVYFDPGSREDVPVEELAKNWHKNGVRAVYLAAWHDYAKYTFEYGYLTDLLHKNGILAYAWFDLPGVSDRFWQEHPQWREKTAAGTDAEMDVDIGWKQYMNFTNDTCRAGAYNALKRLLLLAPWDGVVMTGHMFAGTNPDSLRSLTPFHPTFRARYAYDRGYDPIRIFDAESPYSVKKNPKYWHDFLAYRDSVEQSLTADVIGFLKQQRPLQKPGAEIILTRPFAGASAYADSLYRRLMDEDKQVRIQAVVTRSELGPTEFEADLAAWKSAYPKWNPMIEVQLEKQRPAGEMTAQLCGMELMDLVSTAGRSGTRLSLRTEDLIYDTDFRMLAYAAASATRERLAGPAWEIDSRGDVAVDLDNRANPEVLVDGVIWPAYDKGRLLLPQGAHRLEGCPRLLSWKTVLQSPVRIAGFNGNVIEAGNSLQGLWLRYESPLPTSLALTQAPLEVSLDGLPLGAANPTTADSRNIAVTAGIGSAPSATSLSLPAGAHIVKIQTRSLSTSLMRQASIGLSGLIIVISSITVLAFGLLYIGGAAKRLYSGDESAK